MGTPDYYRILGVAPYSEDVVIQAAYRALMRRYHPDASNSADAGKRATEINEAYAVLGDPGRRERYDAERKATRARTNANSGSTSQRQQSAPPPPPRPTGQANSATAQPSRSTVQSDRRRGAWVATGLIGSFVLVSVLAAGGGGVSVADKNMALENLTVDNLVIEADSVPAPTPPAPQTLENIPQTPVQFEDIESAAVRFVQALTKRGVSGARSVSEKCHAKVAAEPTWSSADWCAAFDYAAAHLDSKVSGASGWAPMPYFQFQAENQADRYKEAGAVEYLVNPRLRSIKTAAESAVSDAIDREIRKSQQTEDAPAEPFQVEANDSIAEADDENLP